MENKSNPMKITVKSAIEIVFRNKKMIIITFILCILFTLVGIQFVTPVYDADVKMLIRGQNIVASDLYESINTRGLQGTQAEIVKSYPVLKRAAISLNLHNRPLDYEKQFCSKLKKFYIDYQVKKTEREIRKLTPEEQEEIKLNAAIYDLKGRLSVDLLRGTDIFVINVTAFSPQEAIETANVISRSYTMFDQIQQLAEVRMRYGEFHPTVIQLTDNIAQATNNLSGKALPDDQAIGTASVKIIEQAISSYTPVSKPKRIILSIAFFIAICISFGLAFIYGIFDRTIKSPQDIVDHLDIPCIGSIPEKGRKEKYLITDDSPYTKYYSFYEELSEQLLVFLRTQRLKTAVISSPLYNNDHKYIVPNIGYFLTNVMKNKVLLVEINFNDPQFQKIYSMQDANGFDGNTNLDMPEDFMYKLDRGLDIVPAKKSSEKPLNILRKINFQEYIEKNRNEYDAILIDATSVNSMKDISFISEYSDGTVLIIDEQKLQSDMLKNTLPRLKENDVVIIGGILNSRTFPIPEFIYKNFKYFID